ncbi:hypothetical protein CEP52_001152 [Fusarium oligoseptatum]|uniref:2EXR domain-containing protein n=1 Tax=Fusarium oligoseptatum TaxID=2604345 RepID=A0A428UJT0_9HYPO|nr:hypothetical protein CEP52_001152 [Fusarium oligoseptatum]
MPLETFHIFPNLPGELREQIWRCALRPDGPTRRGAHFFGIVNLRRDEKARSWANHALKLRWSTFDLDICLVGPQWEPTSIQDQSINKPEPGSWIDNNPSTYLIDSGLWMACKESRNVIDQVLHQQQPDGTRTKKFTRMPLAYRNEAYMPDDTKDRFITVFPRQDLFCFQAYDWATLDGNIISGGIPLLLNNFGGARDMAVRYDSKWGIEANHPGDYEWGMILQNLSNIAIHVTWKSGVVAFWLIDYRIKRRHHVPTKEQADMPAALTFYHQGRRLVDVDFHCEDSLWELDYDVAEDEMSGNMFVHALQEAASQLIHRVPEEEVLRLPRFGILACEED